MAAPRRPVDWAPEAVSDLFDIWNYYAQVAGPPTANAIIGKIREACRVLEEHPFAGRNRDEIRPGLRCVVSSPHIVFYRIADDAAAIVRVIDGRRDIDDVFADTPSDE